MGLLLLYLVGIALLGQRTEAGPVVRQNIGVIYEQLPGQIVTGHDTHQIILAVPYTLPAIPQVKPHISQVLRQLQGPALGPVDSSNARLIQQALDLDRLVDSLQEHIVMTMKNIIHFLSDPINNRPKRAILAFLGELFKTIFGLATTKDIDAILNTIRELDGRLGMLADSNVDMAQGLNDLSRQQKDFIDTYLAGQDAIEHALLNITDGIDSWTDDFSTTLTTIQDREEVRAAQSALISAQTIVVMTRVAYHQGLAKVENSLRLLSTGTLAPDMIRPTELAEKLRQFNTQLKVSNPGSEVTVMDTAYYYSQPVALYTYSKTHLYVHINVIISSTDSAFNLFQIIKTDVPINTEDTNSTGSTRISNDRYDFLAVNEAGDLFLEMTNADLLTCQGVILKVCSRTIPRIRSDTPTCHMAAFMDDQKAISTLCSFQIQPLKPLHTTAIAIDKDSYLVTTNQELYHVICQHKTPTTKRATAYSVVGVPCNCHLQYDGLYLPNTRIPCNDTISVHFLMHTVNMPILFALSEITTEISSSSLHSHPIKMPKIHTTAIIAALSPLHPLPKDVTMDLVPFT